MQHIQLKLLAFQKPKYFEIISKKEKKKERKEPANKENKYYPYNYLENDYNDTCNVVCND